MEKRVAVQSIEALIQQYGTLVFREMYSLTGCWNESQALTEETFFHTLLELDAARAAGGPQFQTEAWLLRAARDTVCVHRRQQRMDASRDSA